MIASRTAADAQECRCDDRKIPLKRFAQHPATRQEFTVFAPLTRYSRISLTKRTFSNVRNWNCFGFSSIIESHLMTRFILNPPSLSFRMRLCYFDLSVHDAQLACIFTCMILCMRCDIVIAWVDWENQRTREREGQSVISMLNGCVL